MSRYSYGVVACALFWTTLPGQTALAVPAHELFDLSLQELMSVSVETPSKLPQSLAGAAGAVSVYSRDEIAMFGGRDLADVLGRMTGVQPMQSAILQAPLSVRGDPATVNNNHVLILLNGMPFNREGYLGGFFNHIMLTSIPLDAIRQIEVVRGPGSVLYGSNAFAGVINIITRDEVDVTSTVGVGAGNFNTRQGEATLASHGEDWQIAGYLQYANTEGQTLQTSTPTDTFEFDQSLHTPGAVFTGRYGKLRVNAYWGESEFDQLRGTVLQPFEGETAVEKRYLNLGYDQPLAERWTLKLDAGIMQSKPFVQIDAINSADYRFDDRHYEVQLEGRLSDNLQWVSGIAHDQYHGSIDPVIVPKWDYDSWSGYSELQYQWHQTRLIGGVQFNKADSIDLNTVPRLGVIQHFTETLGMKILYSQAFRAPTIGETGINTLLPLGSFILKGNPDLEHELVTTADLQLFYNSDEAQLALTLFHTQQEDLIVRTIDGSTITFINQGELTILGAELEGKAVLRDNWYAIGSVTWQENENGDKVKNTTLLPDAIIKTGIAYRETNWSLGVFNTHYGASPDVAIVVPTRLEVNPPAKSYNLLSANFNVRLPAFHDVQVELYLDNLLDETIYRPVVPGSGLQANTVPARDGRYGQISVTVPVY